MISQGFRQAPLIRFFEQLDRAADLLFDEPAFTLILGAGASHSAGIPIAAEMANLLRLTAARRFPLSRAPRRESELSYLFRTVLDRVIEDIDEVRTFVSRCVRRGSREPNLTHLIVANLACTRFFKTIVTTNFDDQLLAAFWDLPPNAAYVEPYVVFHPRATVFSKMSVGEEIPVIIKAHGHHTQYGIGVLDDQVRRLAPFVKRSMRWSPKPRLGYLVIGYSGSMDDGVIAALSDTRITRGARIYWFFRGKQPFMTRYIRQVLSANDVLFIRCDDSDYLFLKLLRFLQGQRGSAWLLDSYDLYTRHGPADMVECRNQVTARWWKPSPGPTGASRAQRRRDLGVPQLRARVLPLLDQLDRWDEQSLPRECVLRRWPEPASQTDGSHEREESPFLQRLRETMGFGIPWTRRNRKLLRLAIDPHIDPLATYVLMKALHDLAVVREPNTA